jgi:hypothetical protein
VRTIKALVTRFEFSHESGKRRRGVTARQLQLLVSNYNDTPHDSLAGMSPEEVDVKPSLKMAVMLANAVHNSKRRQAEAAAGRNLIAVGDTVRVLRRRGLFDKEQPAFSRALYEVTAKQGNLYSVRRRGAEEDEPRQRKRNELSLVADPDAVQFTARRMPNVF